MRVPYLRRRLRRLAYALKSERRLNRELIEEFDRYRLSIEDIRSLEALRPDAREE